MIRDREIDALVTAVGEIPWLMQLGAPLDPDEPPLVFRLAFDRWNGQSDPWSSRLPREEVMSAKRLRSFAEWKGPEDPGSEALADDVNAAHRHMVDNARWLDRRQLRNAYARVHARVTELAARNVPYQPECDPWYGPNAAVWSASAIAGLMAVYRLARTWPGTAIERQWQWYRCGHWPAAYDDEQFPVVY